VQQLTKHFEAPRRRRRQSPSLVGVLGGLSRTVQPAAWAGAGGVVRAVDGVSFRAEAGHVFGLLGPNGAGKTTTMRMLATTVTPTSGTASVAGFDIRRDPIAVRRHIGVLTTSIGLYARLTARENVAYYASLYGMDPSAADRRIDALFKLLDMGEFADRRADNFSTGMKQKVAIARAVVHDPPVMIFDEPTAGLDVMASRTVVEFIRAARDAGKCVILSTHIMREVEKLCDTACIIYQGRVVASGTPGDLVRRTGQDDLEDAFLSLVGVPAVAQPEAAHA
jgi:sodium transport system ATP-binding protein